MKHLTQFYQASRIRPANARSSLGDPHSWPLKSEPGDPTREGDLPQETATPDGRAVTVEHVVRFRGTSDQNKSRLIRQLKRGLELLTEKARAKDRGARFVTSLLRLASYTQEACAEADRIVSTL